MTLQTIFIVFSVVAYLASGAAGAIAYVREQRKATDEESRADTLQVRLDAIDAKMNVIIQHVSGPEEINKPGWNEITLSGLPDAVTAYALLLFRTQRGMRILGEAQIKGNPEVYPFSTFANAGTPIAARNVWLRGVGIYNSPVVLRYRVTERSNAVAELEILTAGWIDARDTEPH